MQRGKEPAVSAPVLACLPTRMHAARCRQAAAAEQPCGQRPACVHGAGSRAAATSKRVQRLRLNR